MQRIASLYIAASELQGRGVFTAEAIPNGSLIEICPVIILPEEDRRLLDQTGLYDYYFIWGEEDRKTAIVLGYGSLYNHSFTPNAQYRPDYPGESLDFYAREDIPAGAEITVNYNGDPTVGRDVWFKAV